MSMFSSVATSSVCENLLNLIDTLEKEERTSKEILEIVKGNLINLKKSADAGYE